MKKIVLNTDINESKRVDIKNAMLFGVRETHYLDCEIIEHPLDKTTSDFIIAPVKKVGYDFFFYDNDEKEHGRLSVKLQTIFFGCIPVERVFIQKDYSSSYGSLSSFTYTPTTNCPFSCVWSEEDEFSKYEINLFGEYFGFISEFGETKHWTQNAQGIIHLPFFEENRLYYDKIKVDETLYIMDWNRYWTYLSDSHIYHKKNRELLNTVVDAVITRRNRVVEVISSKTPSAFKRTREYYVTEVSSGISSNYCSTDSLDFSQKGKIVRKDRCYKFDFFTNSEFCGKTMDVLHGFTLSFDNKVEELYDILRIGGENVNFYKY